MDYIHLYREKWIRTIPAMVYAHYYEGETDKNGKVMGFEEFEYFPVTISHKNPGM